MLILKDKLVEMGIVRDVIGICLIIRGISYIIRKNVYKGINDFCMAHRITESKAFKRLSYRYINKYVRQATDKEGNNAILKSFINDGFASKIVKNYLPANPGRRDIFRDIIVLKQGGNGEKGVILFKYTNSLRAILALFDLGKIYENYYVVLEPSWAGYCDAVILMYVANKPNVIVECFTDEDFEFISNLNGKMAPIKIGPADWVDTDRFVPVDDGKKEYDLIMVANWGRYKRHVELFKALGKIKDRPIKVLLIGFEWEGRNKHDIIREANMYINDNVYVEIKENLAYDEINKYLCLSKCFVFLSAKEGDNKALVESLFCNVPAIVYDKTVGGARYRINEYTGIYSSYQELSENIIYMMDNYEAFAPRKWMLKATGSRISTNRLNEFIKNMAFQNREKYSTGIVRKINSPNLAYNDASMYREFADDYEFLRKCLRRSNVDI